MMFLLNDGRLLQSIKNIEVKSPEEYAELMRQRYEFANKFSKKW